MFRSEHVTYYIYEQNLSLSIITSLEIIFIYFLLYKNRRLKC